MNPEIFDNYWLEKSLMDFDQKVEIHLHSTRYLEENDNFKVLMNFCEPQIFRNISYAETIAKHKKFDLILDFDEQILKECDNAHLMLFGTTWIKESPKFKKSEISFLCGGKTFTKGHIQRLILFEKQDEINKEKTFWQSSNFPINKFSNNPILPSELHEKIKMFNCTHHIAIENVSQNNWFTEKLIDCFVTRTIPIFIGCPNIGNYFNIEGMHIFETVDDLIEGVNKINLKEDYLQKQDAIESNYWNAKEYTEPIEKRLQKVIRSYL